MSEQRKVNLGAIDESIMQDAAHGLGYTTSYVDGKLCVRGKGLYRDIVFATAEDGTVSCSYDDMNTEAYAEIMGEYADITIQRKGRNRVRVLSKSKTGDEVILKLQRRA